jgi:hypothetical protein
MITYKKFQGITVASILTEIKKLRKEVYMGDPYYYAYDEKIEDDYWSTFSHNTEALCVIAKESEDVVGIITGIPLSSGAKIIADIPELFKQHSYNPEKFFYISDVMVKANWTGQGIATKMLRFFEKASGYKCFSLITIVNDICIKRYLWEKEHYFRTGIMFTYSWPTIKNGKIITGNHELKFYKYYV